MRAARGARSFARLARLAFALLLALLVSGAPTALALALGFEADACACECLGSTGSKQCPPCCGHVSCATVLSAVPVVPRAVVAPHPATVATVPAAPLPALHSLWQPGGLERPPRR